MTRIARRKLLLATPALLLPAALARAQAFPSRPIKLLCPFAPGGAVDIASRGIAQEMSGLLGQPVLVENKPGAGGNVAGAEVAKAPPDGYTLFMTSNGIQTFNPTLYAKMPFDPNTDFSYVAPLVSFNYVLVVGAGNAMKGLSELIEMARKEPRKMSFASSGNGTSMHLSGEMFKSMARVDILHVPYKGSAPALSDLFSGTVTMMFGDIPGVVSLIKGGKLKALAVTGAQRSPMLPDVPTVAEAGLADYEVTAWLGLVAPAGTPPAIVAALNAAAVKAAESKPFRDRMEPIGFNIIAGPPASMAAMVRRDLARWVPVIKAADVKMN